MAGRTCLVTGATSGIGKATAAGLARLGADLVLVARDRARAEATVAEIKAATGNPRIELLVADLASQASIRQAVQEYRRGHDRLHVLVNNAGGFWATRHSTVDGLEWTFAVNHLAYFLLTNLLLELLVASAPARIVNVTSSAQAIGDIHLDDLQFQRRYRGQAAYNQSKLANVLFTYELARRLEGTGVTVNCGAPGVTRTNFGRDDSGRSCACSPRWPAPSCAPRAGRRHRRLPRLLPRGGGRDRRVLRQWAREAVLQAVL
jgi:retinol dehydrogenase-14